VEETAAPASKSAVSRRFVAATETALAELMSRRLDDLDLVAFMVDGVHFGEHTCVLALGIGIDGTKHPLAVEEGSTENATLVTSLITGLRERGLDGHGRSWLSWTGPKRSRARSRTSSTSRSSKDASSTRSKTSGTSCPNGCGRWLSGGCGRPPTPNLPSKPRAC
jgi:Transposase, Mutator family